MAEAYIWNHPLPTVYDRVEVQERLRVTVGVDSMLDAMQELDGCGEAVVRVGNHHERITVCEA